MLFLFKELSKIFKDFCGKFQDFSRISRKFAIFKDFSRPVRTMKVWIYLVKEHPRSDVQHTFLHISLPSLHDYIMKMPDVTFCGELKEAKTRFSFSF